MSGVLDAYLPHAADLKTLFWLDSGSKAQTENIQLYNLTRLSLNCLYKTVGNSYVMYLSSQEKDKEKLKVHEDYEKLQEKFDALEYVQDVPCT